MFTYLKLHAGLHFWRFLNWLYFTKVVTFHKNNDFITQILPENVKILTWILPDFYLTHTLRRYVPGCNHTDHTCAIKYTSKVSIKIYSTASESLFLLVFNPHITYWTVNMASFHQCLIIPSIAVKIIQNVSKFLERTDLVCATDDIHEYLLSYFHTTTIFVGDLGCFRIF